MEKQLGYVMPHAPEGVTPADLMSTTSSGPVREPAEDEKVLCINRGREVLIDQFDSRHVEIPPGLFYIEYAAAKHFQRRLIVKGTKNLSSGAYVSYIGIQGVNAPELCEPFTDAQLEKWGESFEAVDRSADYGLGRDVTPVSVNGVRASSPMLGMQQRGPGSSRGIDVSEQASEVASAAAAAVLEPSAESDTRAAAAEAASERGGDAPRRGARR